MTGTTDTNVIPSTIEREILIEAPIDIVWRAVTEPEQIKAWFTDTAELDLRPGGEGRFTWSARAKGKPGTARITVEALEVPNRFAFRWGHPDDVDPDEGNSLLVEFLLTGVDDAERTRLRVVESGLHDLVLPNENKTAYVDEHGRGWEGHLADLASYAKQQS
jgi:uncharacterized protein YndB with AHSA1/START domain